MDNNSELIYSVTPLGLAAAFDAAPLEMVMGIPAIRDSGSLWTYESRPYEGRGDAGRSFGEDPYLAGLLSWAAERRRSAEGAPLDSDTASGMVSQAASAGAVLLKNHRRTLPITGVYFRRVAVTGIFAGSTAEALRGIEPRIEWMCVPDADAGICAGCDATIICMGESEAAPFSTRLPEEQTLLFDRVSQAGRPVIAAVCGRSPLCLDDIDRRADALLWLWWPFSGIGTVLASLLMGKSNPSGRLPVTFNREGESTYLTMRGEPLYPFGYGMSYTRFKYAGLRISGMTDDGGLTVSCEVTNAGQAGGHEVSQLYLRREGKNLMGLPRWRLIRTKRFYLRPGEAREVSFVLSGGELREGAEFSGDGRLVLYAGGHQPDARSVWLTETPVLSVFLDVKGGCRCLRIK